MDADLNGSIDDLAEVMQVDEMPNNGGEASTDVLNKKQRLDEKRLARIMAVPEGEDLFGTTSQLVAKLVVECPKCLQQLGATRFAHHYEKCLNKGSRARANSTVASLPLSKASSEQGEWNAPCSTCRGLETPEMLVMCDGCSRVYHIWCLVPRLSEIPEGIWMCRKCSIRIVQPPDVDGISSLNSTPLKKRGRLSAVDKSKKGRVPVGVEVVDFYCDLCNNLIPPEQTRFRCVACGEFDVCVNCKSKGGLGHRASHPMVEMRVN
jgi:hypothetical protein